MSIFTTHSPIVTRPTLLNFATNPYANANANADIEPDPDPERLATYEPGYVDGKGPNHDAAVRHILTANPGYLRRHIVAALPSLVTQQILAAFPPRSR